MSSQLLYPAAKRNKPAVFALSPETDEWEMDRYNYDDDDDDDDPAACARVPIAKSAKFFFGIAIIF